MKSISLHLSVLALLAATAGACKTGSQPISTGGGFHSQIQMEPGTKVGVIDGQPLTYGDLEKEQKDLGAKIRQAEIKFLTETYDLRKNAVDEVISKRLLEGEAKAKGKTLEQWFQTDFMNSLPAPSEAEVRAFYEEHKAQIPQGQTFEQIKDRLTGMVKQGKGREQMGKLLDDLKKKHGVEIALAAPDLPRVEVAPSGPARGPDGAKVTIVEFSDFQCPYCGREVPVVERVMKEYDGKVRLVFRHFPLDFHPFAQKAAEAGACAAEQGKFWPMHDKMFGNQQKLGVDELKGYAKEVGLDATKFDQCLDSGAKKPLVDGDEKAGAEAGVSGTPAFFVNGLFINGAQPYEQFKEVIDRELKSKG